MGFSRVGFDFKYAETSDLSNNEIALLDPNHDLSTVNAYMRRVLLVTTTPVVIDFAAFSEIQYVYVRHLATLSGVASTATTGITVALRSGAADDVITVLPGFMTLIPQPTLAQDLTLAALVGQGNVEVVIIGS
jgi:hypothetical protein